MLWLDIKYANLLSVKLDKYRITKNNPYSATFRCPICGDSAKNPNKTRGYFYVAYSSLRMKCHNCGVSTYFTTFLERVDNNLFSRYNMDKFGAKETETDVIIPEKSDMSKIEPRLLDNLLDKVSSLPEDHEARQYVKARHITDNMLDRLYFIDDVSKIAQLKESYREKIVGTEARLVFPFYNRKGLLVGVTMRAIGEHKLRYIAVRLNSTEPMIFNYDGVNFEEQVYCVEGPIDSLFLPNCVAVGGSDMKSVRKLLPLNTIYIFDNQPRNAAICKLMNGMIMSGFRICIFPISIEQKDVNDMVSAGIDVTTLIYTNSYSGLEAQLKFEEWRKL